MFFSLNNRDDTGCRPPTPDLRSIIREGELKLLDESDQEHVHLNDAASRQASAFPKERMSDHERKSPSDTTSDTSGEGGTTRASAVPEGQITVTHRFPYTPIGDSGSPFASSHRPGRHSNESAPHTAGFLQDIPSG